VRKIQSIFSQIRAGFRLSILLSRKALRSGPENRWTEHEAQSDFIAAVGGKTGFSRHGDRRMGRLDDLPPPGIKRWVIRRKAEVVAAVRAGILSLDEALRALQALSRGIPLLAAFDSNRHGLRGLAARQRIQDYRASDQTLRGSNDD